jgi:hypothetical protein
MVASLFTSGHSSIKAFDEPFYAQEMSSEPGQSTVKVLTEALGSKPKTAVASAELLELEELMHDFELEYGKMHLTGGYSTDDGASSSQEGTRHLQHAVHATYAELYNAVPLDMVFRMKAAMQEIPEV